jgi:DNA primase
VKRFKHLAQSAGMQAILDSQKKMKKEKKKWKEFSSIYSRYVDFYHDELLKNETNLM